MLHSLTRFNHIPTCVPPQTYFLVPGTTTGLLLRLAELLCVSFLYKSPVSFNQRMCVYSMGHSRSRLFWSKMKKSRDSNILFSSQTTKRREREREREREGLPLPHWVRYGEKEKKSSFIVCAPRRLEFTRNLRWTCPTLTIYMNNTHTVVTEHEKKSYYLWCHVQKLGVNVLPCER